MNTAYVRLGMGKRLRWKLALKPGVVQESSPDFLGRYETREEAIGAAVGRGLRVVVGKRCRGILPPTMSNGPKTNKTKKQNKKPAKKTVAVTQSRGVQVAYGTADEGGEIVGGDALQVYDLPGADRECLARHLTMVAGSVLATKGDPLDGATIVVVTRRKS